MGSAGLLEEAKNAKEGRAKWPSTQMCCYCMKGDCARAVSNEESTEEAPRGATGRARCREAGRTGLVVGGTRRKSCGEKKRGNPNNNA